VNTRPRRFGLKPDEMTEPAGYPEWTADQKHAWLWKILISGTAHAETDLPPLRMPFKAKPLREIAVVTRRDELVKALTRSSELMEPGRPKVIHAHGAVAMITLETAKESPFTGLLGSPPDGGASGLIRMSMVAKVEGKAAVTPAFGLKLLVDGMRSADVLAMNHTVGQGRDFDMFSNSMTNDLSDKHTALRPPQQMMSVLFSRVTERPREMVSNHLVAQRRDGAAVDRPVAPQRVIFDPTPDAKQIFANNAGVDFRIVLSTTVPIGTPLYDVAGELDDGTKKPIGVLKTTTKFASSDGGDGLFFRHEHDPNNLKL
jgi:hypothetical protein